MNGRFDITKRFMISRKKIIKDFRIQGFQKS